ncbi:MAG: hypothetical protein MZU91_04585 [Desulfosudis oleivorans]|nr:hypothetical protein [Desulfosudis oleivorans]
MKTASTVYLALATPRRGPGVPARRDRGHEKRDGTPTSRIRPLSRACSSKQLGRTLDATEADPPLPEPARVQHLPLLPGDCAHVFRLPQPATVALTHHAERRGACDATTATSPSKPRRRLPRLHGQPHPAATGSGTERLDGGGRESLPAGAGRPDGQRHHIGAQASHERILRKPSAAARSTSSSAPR